MKIDQRTKEVTLTQVEYHELINKPVSEELEEVAEKYAYTNWQSDEYHDGADKGLPFDAIGHTEKAFKAGAEWQLSKMMSDAIPADVYKGYIASKGIAYKYGVRVGDNIRIIVIKE